MKQIEKIPTVFLWLVGALCILFPTQVADVLPFLLGSVMLAVGVMRMGVYLWDKRFLEGETPELGQDIIVLVMGVVFLCAGTEAVGLMGVVWGIIGLKKAAETINQALRQFCLHQKALLAAAEAAIRVVLALALLFNPFEKFSAHMVLLGVELILTNIRLPREACEKR